jgi:hypothetical protein
MIMRVSSSTFLRYAALIALAFPISVSLAAPPQGDGRQGIAAPAQQTEGARPKPQDTEVWDPVAAHPGATSSHLGTELDLIADYKQNRHVTYGFGFCHLFTGEYLNQATHGKDYNYPFAYVTYVF